jgi:endonuclease YncB( thermonuclease family)
MSVQRSVEREGRVKAAKLAAVATAALLGACGGGTDLDALADGGVAAVTAVVDGDTIALSDGRRVELAGVAAPEGTEPHAAESRAALEKLALGHSIRLLYGGSPEGPFHLREARRRRLWVQRDLVAAGAVRVRSGSGDRALVRTLLREEAEARAARRGLWGLPAYEVRLPSEVIARRETGFLVVEGRVVRVAEQAGRTYLEFSRDWRGGFSAEVPSTAAPGFASADVDLQALEGRLVRVRGEVRRTGFGPRLQLDHPEQVERLTEQAGR